MGRPGPTWRQRAPRRDLYPLRRAGERETPQLVGGDGTAIVEHAISRRVVDHRAASRGGQCSAWEELRPGRTTSEIQRPDFIAGRATEDHETIAGGIEHPAAPAAHRGRRSRGC